MCTCGVYHVMYIIMICCHKLSRNSDILYGALICQYLYIGMVHLNFHKQYPLTPASLGRPGETHASSVYWHSQLIASRSCKP